MGEPKVFLKCARLDVGKRPVADRVRDWRHLELPLTPDQTMLQAARCADCGIPFCHGTGCPLGNRIPEFNELVSQGRWRQACENLHSTNNFPEITGHVCPAPCEAACTLAVNDNPVLIRHIEYQIVEKGFQEGWIKPLVPTKKSGRRVAVIGSGPAGLAAAQQLARAGHETVVFEKDDKVGGILRYGIPDFKLEKHIIDRRIRQLIAEGVKFQTSVAAGGDISGRYLRKMFDFVCLAMGAGQARDIDVPGRNLAGIVFAMDYLSCQNRLNASEAVDDSCLISAREKNVVVIGGGDTGSDCVGTAIRQGARKIYQLEILPKPPDAPAPDTPWPMWPRMMRTSSSHEEGCERMWSAATTEFQGKNGRVQRLRVVGVQWVNNGGKWEVQPVPGSESVLEADLVLIAMGFVHVTHEGLVSELGLEFDDRGNIKIDGYKTSAEGIFAAGDAATGASLVVSAIDGGRRAAEAINKAAASR